MHLISFSVHTGVDPYGEVPKPKGPLIADHVKKSSLHLSWNADNPEEFRNRKIKFRVQSSLFSYTDTSIGWKDLGITASNEFVVSGLEEDKQYKFKVTGVLGDLESRPLYSVKVRTKSSGNYFCIEFFNLCQGLKKFRRRFCFSQFVLG